jgi:hypothetical protein
MPNVSLETLVRKSFESLKAQSAPINLATVLKNLNAPSGMVIDTDKAENALLKSFFVNPGNYTVQMLNGDAVYAPSDMSVKEIESLLNPRSVSKPRAKSAPRDYTPRTVFNYCQPTTRGRLRVPVRVMRGVASAGDKVFVTKSGDSIRIRPTKIRGVQGRFYTVDRYNNLLFPAPTEGAYKFSASRGVITASLVG